MPKTSIFYDGIQYDIEFTKTPYDPGRTNCRNDDVYPPEGGECTIDSITDEDQNEITPHTQGEIWDALEEQVNEKFGGWKGLPDDDYGQDDNDYI